MQERIELCNMPQRPRLSSTKILGDFALTKRGSKNKTLQINSQGWQKAIILLPRGGSCHPMPPHDYGPEHEPEIWLKLRTRLSLKPYCKTYFLTRMQKLSTNKMAMKGPFLVNLRRIDSLNTSFHLFSQICCSMQI